MSQGTSCAAARVVAKLEVAETRQCIAQRDVADGWHDEDDVPPGGDGGIRARVKCGKAFMPECDRVIGTKRPGSFFCRCIRDAEDVCDRCGELHHFPGADRG